MASREERMQQRLRGAQRRQVKDVDFGLVFPAIAPEPDVADSHASPQPEFPQPEAIQQLPSRSPAPRTRVSNAAIPAETVPAGSHSMVDANTSAKRRKLDTDNTPLSYARSTRSQRLPRPDIYALEDDQQDETVLDMLLDSTNGSIPTKSVATPSIRQPAVTSTPATRSRARTPSLPIRIEEEVVESSGDAPGSGYRIRHSSTSTTAARPQPDVGLEESTVQADTTTPIQRNKRKRGESRIQTPHSVSKQARHTPMLQDESFGLDELSPEQPSFREAGTAEMSEAEPVQEQASIQGPEEAEAIEDEQAAAILKRNRGRRVSRGGSMHPSDVDNPAFSPIAKKRRGRHRISSTHVQQRQPKQAATKSKAAKTGKKVQIGSPIPVTVHRFTNPLVYDDEEENADILNSEIPQTKRAGVSTIDVLMEVTSEIVGTAMQTLDDGGRACQDAALRREYKTKWQAVAAFGKELQTRLLEHTINLDNGYSLDKRLRNEQRRRLRLREEILQIRAEREQVALRMDDVRIKHENDKRVALSQGSLDASVHDVELAIDLGRAQKISRKDGLAETIGTEVLLKRVAGEVSNASNSGGLLGQIKGFNAFLERVAVALESRKG